VAAFIFRTGEIFGGEDDEIDSPVPKQARNQKRETLDSGKVEIEVGFEFFEEMLIKHPNFGRPPAAQAFYCIILLIFSELVSLFCRVV